MIKYHGGKHYLTKSIYKILNNWSFITFVETHCGGCSVTMGLDMAVAKIVNDLDKDLTNFWEVLQDTKLFEEFKRQISATPFSQIEFDKAVKLLQSNEKSKKKRACAFYVLARQSMAGRQQGFTPLTISRTRGGISADANAWINSINGLDEVHKNLIPIVIVNDDAIKVIKKYDGQKTCFYVDPPYLQETRVSKKVYKHEMTEAQHEELLTVLSCINGHFVLSGYHSKLYDKFASKYNWNLEEISIKNHSSSSKKKPTKKECLWFK